MTRNVSAARLWIYLFVTLFLGMLAACGGGGGASSETPGIVSPETVPDAPGNLVALTLSGERIALGWDDNAENETGYRIEKSTDFGLNFSGLTSLATNVNNYTDAETASGTTFCYRVQAFNKTGSSAYSNTACAGKTSQALSPVVISDGTGREWPAEYGAAFVSRWKGDKIAAYSLTIDDNCLPDVDWWREQSAAFGFKFTWFLITGYIGGSSSSFYGTWPPYVTLASEGHDIQSHTVTHNHLDLTIEEQYSISQQAILDNIPGATADCLAYPCGYPGYPSCAQANDSDIARKYYIAARGTTGHNNKIGSTDYYDVNAIGVINISNTATRWNYLPDIHIYYAADPRNFGAWQNSLFHGVSDSETRDAIIAGLTYLKNHEADIWFGLFREVALYGQERETATVTVTKNTADEIRFTLTDTLPDTLFRFPLTVKVRLDSTWTNLTASQNGMPVNVSLQLYEGGIYALVGATPDAGTVVLARVQ